MGDSGAVASRAQLRLVSDTQTGDEVPLHSIEELEQFAQSDNPRVAHWAVRTLLRLNPANAGLLLDRSAERGAPAVVETILLAAITERKSLNEKTLQILLRREDDALPDLALLASLLCGTPLPIESFEPSPAGRIALWISDQALGTDPRVEPPEDFEVAETTELVLSDAVDEWLQAIPIGRVLDIFVRSTRLPSCITATLIVSAIASRLGVPEVSSYLCGVLEMTSRPELPQKMFDPIRDVSPRAFEDTSITEPARTLVCASPSRIPDLAALALQLIRAHRREIGSVEPAWARLLGDLADRTRRDAQTVVMSLSNASRLGPCANVAGPLLAAAVLASARDAAWVGAFAGRDDDRSFVRALCETRAPTDATEELIERANRIDASRFVDLVAESSREKDPANLSLPLAVLALCEPDLRVDATTKLLLTTGGQYDTAERLLESLRPLGWKALPKVTHSHRVLPPAARNATLEYLTEFPCRRTLDALLDAFPFYARSEWPGHYWNALAATGAPDAFDKLAREWRPGEVTIARAIGFLADLYPELQNRRRAIFEDLEAHEAALENDRPPVLLPLHCKACGRTSEHLVHQVILWGESVENSAPNRILLCKYCGAPESWRHTRESLENFDEALAVELEEIARRGTLQLDEARFVDVRRLSEAAGRPVRTPREQFEASLETLQENPNDPESLLTLGRLYRRGGWVRRATSPLSRLVDRHPDHIEGHVEFAFLKLDRRKYDSAAEEYERAAAMFCCTSLKKRDRLRIGAELEDLANRLHGLGRLVHRVMIHEGQQVPDMSATASFGGFEPSSGESFEQLGARLERELSGNAERPCPCGSGASYRGCCGTLVWLPFVS